jgi:hypothetical protein
MAQDLNAEQAKNALRLWIGEQARAKIKTLLETKHLYQKVEIELGETPKNFYDRVYVQQSHQFANWFNGSFANEHFDVRLSLGKAEMDLILLAEALPLILPNLSLYCKLCERKEAFAPIGHADLIDQILMFIAQGKLKPFAMPANFQMFSLVYQCQRCLGVPESFLVRREGWSFNLQGRSPIEHVEVPGYIPKPESKYYRDAIIASNTGKTLAALFYLRIFVEQFARRITGKKGKVTGDVILDAYYQTLPKAHADHMPSLREWYDKLSEGIHSATEDVPLFETAKAQIEEHFDIRRVFKIPEVETGSIQKSD